MSTRAKSAERRELNALEKAVKKRIAEMRAERLQPLRDLEKRQRRLRGPTIQALIREARQRGIEVTARVAALVAAEVDYEQHRERLGVLTPRSMSV